MSLISSRSMCPVLSERMVLSAPYAVSGTERAYGATGAIQEKERVIQLFVTGHVPDLPTGS
eukprot:2493872-Rhodomonas_salina.1